MKKIWIFVTVVFIFTSMLYAEDYSLPVPPREFFVKLAKTKIPPGKSCCNELRRMLGDSVSISPLLTAKLFREGKLMIADARTSGEYAQAHIVGAVSLPFDKVDFMKLKPINIPIALY